MCPLLPDKSQRCQEGSENQVTDTNNLMELSSAKGCTSQKFHFFFLLFNILYVHHAAECSGNQHLKMFLSMGFYLLNSQA